MNFPDSYTAGDGIVIIRPFQESDVDTMYEAAMETAQPLSRWLSNWFHEGYSRLETEAWISSRDDDWRQGRAYSFAIVDSQTKTLLGGTGINHINRTHRFANLGYWTRASRAGKGITTRGARLAVSFGFQQLGLQRIEIVVEPDNPASIRVAEKLGAHNEGLQRARLLSSNGSADALMFSLLPDDVAHW